MGTDSLCSQLRYYSLLLCAERDMWRSSGEDARADVCSNLLNVIDALVTLGVFVEVYRDELLALPRQVPRLSTVHGFVSGLGYHASTIALGSLLTMLTRPLRILSKLMEAALRTTPGAASSTQFCRGEVYRKLFSSVSEDA